MSLRLRHVLLTALALGCEGQPPSQTPYPPCVESETLERGTLLLEAESLEGTVRGVDLDGRDSDATDELGCHQEDWPDPDGSPVDGQFAALVPTLEAAYGDDGRGIFADTPLTVHVDGRGDGVCAAVSVALDAGPWRTAEWNGSVLRAYDLGDLPLRLTLPEDVSEIVTLHDAAVRMTVVDQRVATVLLSGSVSIADLAPPVAASTVDFDEPVIRTFFEGVADLEPDASGTCTRISIGLEALP